MATIGTFKKSDNNELGHVERSVLWRHCFGSWHADVRIKRSRSIARTTLDAAATPQACPWGAGIVLPPLPRGERESARGTPRI